MTNAAVFRDAWLDVVPAREVTDLIMANLNLAVTGCATAIRRFLAAGTGGAIVNVSSHQAQRAVRGALPYATAKAAVEGLHGPAGACPFPACRRARSSHRYRTDSGHRWTPRPAVSP